MENKPNYLRIESVVYVELKDGETPEEAEARWLDSLPQGVDVVSYESGCVLPEE